MNGGLGTMPPVAANFARGLQRAKDHASKNQRTKKLGLGTV
jgi:hypothetical protein